MEELELYAVDVWFDEITEKHVIEKYENADIGYIVRDIISRYTSFDPSEIPDIGEDVDHITFSYKTVKDALKILAELLNYEFGATAEGKAFFRARGSASSGITLTRENIKPGVRFAESLEETKNIVYVLGSENYVVDQSQETVSSAYFSLNENFFAVKFTPTQRQLRQIELYLDKIGSPNDLLGEIREDSGGLPSDNAVGYFSFSRSFINGAGWWPASLSVELEPGKDYWIVLIKNGDASNTYRWFHDNGVGGGYAYSTDGNTWSLGSGPTPAFKTKYGEPVVFKAVSNDSINTYKQREIIIVDSSIKTYRAARYLAYAKLNELKEKKREMRNLVVLDPTDIPMPGETITINLGFFSDDFFVEGVDIELEGGAKGVMKVSLQLGMTLTEFTKAFGQLKAELKDERLKDLFAQDTLLNLVEAFQAAFMITETISSWSQDSGTFKTDEVKVGYSDCA